MDSRVDPVAESIRLTKLTMSQSSASTESVKLQRATRVTPSHRIGRNHPCPCGSRLKFKRCCLNKKVEALFKEV